MASSAFGSSGLGSSFALAASSFFGESCPRAGTARITSRPQVSDRAKAPPRFHLKKGCCNIVPVSQRQVGGGFVWLIEVGGRDFILMHGRPQSKSSRLEVADFR